MKKLGFIFIIISILLMGFYFGYNYMLNKTAIDDVNEYIENTSSFIDEENENINIEEDVSNSSNKSTSISYTAILEIPSINLKRGLVDSTNNFKSINYAISIDSNSTYPNENGNFILYAHSGNSTIAYFKDLYKVEERDLIYIYLYGIKYEYEVINIYNIEKNGTANVVSTNDDKYITLITCDQTNSDYQIVILAKFVDYTSY